MRFREFKIKPLVEAILDEVSMSPTSLERWASSPDAEGFMMGIEFEMIVPGTSDDDAEFEADYDQNESVSSIREIVDFFSYGEDPPLYGNSASRFHDKLREEFNDYVSENYDSYLSNNREEFDERIREVMFDDYPDWNWCRETAREELGDDADEDEIEERAKELARENIDDQMEDRSSNQYNRAYDEVSDSMRDDYESSVEESDWLESIGVEDALDAMRQWDELYWPYTYRTSGGNSISDVAESLAEALGIDVDDINISSDYHGATREPGKWIIETDSSIANGRDEMGLEFVSPTQSMAVTFEQMEKLTDWAYSYGCRTDSSTGLHMNISFPKYSLANLDYIKLALFMGDKYILDQFSRSTNHYCSSATSVIERYAANDPDGVQQMFAKMREHINAAASKIIHKGITDKYTSINTKDGYIEFRGPGGDYLNKPIEQLTNTAIRLARAMKIACDNEAYSQEYGKKLYKLISAEGNDTTDIFAKYTSGYMSKSQLMDILRLRRNKRGATSGKTTAEKPSQLYTVSVYGRDWEISATSPNAAIEHLRDGLIRQGSDWAENLPISAFTATPVGQPQAQQQQTSGEPYQTTPAPIQRPYMVSVRGMSWQILARSPEEARARIQRSLEDVPLHTEESEYTVVPIRPGN